jgi:hypothetical protein
MRSTPSRVHKTCHPSVRIQKKDRKAVRDKYGEDQVRFLSQQAIRIRIHTPLFHDPDTVSMDLYRSSQPVRIDFRASEESLPVFPDLFRIVAGSRPQVQGLKGGPADTPQACADTMNNPRVKEQVSKSSDEQTGFLLKEHLST